MFLTFVYDDRVSTLDIAENTIVSELLPLLAADFNMDSHARLALLANGREITPVMTIGSAGLQQHDVIQCVERPVQPAVRPPNQPAARPSNQSNAAAAGDIRTPPTGAQMRQLLINQPALVERFRQSDPDLAAALDQSPADYDNLVKLRLAAIERRARIAADPFSLEAQAVIEEEIQAQNIAENMAQALEHSPESFTRVVMLYVPMLVNGHPLKAFVDSGAQSTIMSKACAERCGILRLLDKRFAGVAQGVGTAPILGRVHRVQVQFGSAVFTSSFTILDQGGVEFLLGLDQLRNHRATIDLEANCLRLAGQSVTFLDEKDLPESARSGPEPPTTSSTSQSSSQSSGQSINQSPPPNQPIVAPLPATSSAPRLIDANTPASASQLSTSASQSTNQSTTQSTNQSTAEASIDSLIQLGFSRIESQRALTLHNGDVQRAASFLFSQQFGA